jgi:hypothetical protein
MCHVAISWYRWPVADVAISKHRLLLTQTRQGLEKKRFAKDMTSNPACSGGYEPGPEGIVAVQWDVKTLRWPLWHTLVEPDL